MSRLVKCFAVILISLTFPQGGLGQATSANQSEDETAIICTLPAGFTQLVKLNVWSRNKKEVTDLRHTDFLVYENGKLQVLEFFRVTDDTALKSVGYRYTIGYAPENQTEDGRYRKIRIVVMPSGARPLKVQLASYGYVATKGYFIPRKIY